MPTIPSLGRRARVPALSRYLARPLSASNRAFCTSYQLREGYTDDFLHSIETQARDLAPKGPLLPLLPPKPLFESRQLPHLLQRPSGTTPFGPKHSDWQVQSFVFPAAFPRSVKGCTVAPSDATSKTPTPTGRIDANKVFHDMAQQQLTALKNGSVSIEDMGELGRQEQLYLAVNRYFRKDAEEIVHLEEPNLTLLFNHANGFHKETWEPTIAELLDETNSTESRTIGEIWSLDLINQGDSAVLNESVIGETINWADHGRDALNFLISYLPDTSAKASSASKLPHISSSDNRLLQLDSNHPASSASNPSSRIFRNRLIVAIGHSAGGTALTYSATALPSIFSSLILCDPVLPPPSSEISWAPLSKGAIKRRASWATREEAKEGFMKKAFFRSWDPRALDLYVELGTKDMPDGSGVALKTRPKDEALLFCDPTAVSSRRAASRLSKIDANLPIHFLFADEGRSLLTEPQLKGLLDLVPNATHARIEGAGHLLVQEKPKQTARAIGNFLKKMYPPV